MYKLVLVEDDDVIRNGLSHFFPWKQIGFDLCASFNNGKTALGYLLVHPIDVVLTDVRMPVMDGLTLAQEMKNAHLPACIVFLSAYRNFEYARQAVNLGIRHYVVKSSKYDELVEVFSQLNHELDTTEPLLPSENQFTEGIGERTIQRIDHYIDEHLSEATLQSTAEYVGLSSAYLSRYYKEKTGMNFIEQLVKRKMDCAKKLLSAGLSLSEIGERIGYSNDKNFSRAFKKQYGITPSEYRRFL